MDECIFCKIIKGLIPCQKVYEDSLFLAFLDIAPANPGHVVVVPKAHAEGLLDLPDEYCIRLLQTARKIAEALVKAVNADGFNLIQNNGRAAGQTVLHFHLHIIPRYNGDGVMNLWNPSQTDTGALAETARKITDELR